MRPTDTNLNTLPSTQKSEIVQKLFFGGTEIKKAPSTAPEKENGIP